MVEQALPDAPVSASDPHPHAENQSEVCEKCKRPLPRKRDPEAPRVRKTWALSVPADRQEDGADLMDTLIEESRVLLATHGLIYENTKNTKFTITSTVLALFVQHGNQILSDG